MKFVRCCVFSAISCLLPSVVLAQFDCQQQDTLATAKRDAVLEKLEARYKKLGNLKASFEQESLFLGFNERMKSSGSVVFKKPGMMDWNYVSPEKQRFVADGRNLWFYQPEMNQVTVGKFQQSFQSGLPVSFLLGLGSLTEDFTVASACQGGSGVVVTLKPKVADPSLDMFKLLIDDSKSLPMGAKIVDVAGNETQIVFSSIEADTKVDEAQFSFSIPDGVDVIDQRQASPLATAVEDRE